MSNALTSAAFKEHLHSVFLVTRPDQEPVELELVEHSPGRQSTEVESFVLGFRGPREPMLGQGSFEIVHDEMGTFPLFLVAYGQQADATLYEAVFNRLVDPPLEVVESLSTGGA
jgi:hypothetical protein